MLKEFIDQNHLANITLMTVKSFQNIEGHAFETAITSWKAT